MKPMITMLVTHPDNTVSVFRVLAQAPAPEAHAAAFLAVDSLRRAEDMLAAAYEADEGPATLRSA